VELLHAAIADAVRELIDVEGEAGLVVEVAETAGRAFEMHADVPVNFVAISELALDVLAVVATQRVGIGLGEFEEESGNRAAAEECLALGNGQRRGRCRRASNCNRDDREKRSQ